jgi:CIC family chloride channel protein
MLGMAAVMAGVMHAPLTGIFLIAELTGGYQLLIPLMIVSICAYLTIIIFEPHSIYGMRLAREGKLITHHTDRSVLTLMSLESIIDRHYMAVHPDMELGTLVHALSRSKSDLLPVLDEAGNLLGEINLTNLRHIVFRTELYHHFTVSQLMAQPPATLGMNDPMEEVMHKFDDTDARRLPVLDTDGRLIGYISRTHMYAQYRQMVADFSAE